MSAMEQALSSEHVRRLVLETAQDLSEPLRIEQSDVSEGLGQDGPFWNIRFAAHRPSDRKVWARTRLNLVQSLRDRLLAQGDDRYPVLEVVTPEEWRAGRHA